MSSLYIDLKAAQSCALLLQTNSDSMKQCEASILQVRRGLRFNVPGAQQISSSLSAAENQIAAQRTSLQCLSSTLIQVVSLCSSTEDRNTELLRASSPETEGVDGSGGAFSIDSVLFDDEGSYGGDQGSMARTYAWHPIKCWELLAEIREYFPGMSIFKAFAYFNQLNSVGCGYVALANSLFLEYEGRPDEFERVFGFPMYKDGDLNYDRMILDIYATTDQAGFNDRANGMPDGTLDDTRDHIMRNYLADKNVGVRTEANADITVENFRQTVENGGHVIIGYRFGIMYDEKGHAHKIDGGHAMLVTGVTDDGRFIVSSWGDKYYINASDIGDDDTFMVFYYDS